LTQQMNLLKPKSTPYGADLGYKALHPPKPCLDIMTAEGVG
jgi:hypothetical protein